MVAPIEVLYVFTARKRRLLAGVAAGTDPDTLLFGLNQLRADPNHGVARWEAPSPVAVDFHEPTFGRIGRAAMAAVGRLGPDAVQLRTLPHFVGRDVVFLTGGWPLLFASRLIPAGRRPRMVWLNMTLTNLLRRGGPRAGVIAGAARLADRIVCVSADQQAFLMRRLGLPASRLPVVLNGTDARFFSPELAGSPTSAATSDGPHLPSPYDGPNNNPKPRVAPPPAPGVPPPQPRPPSRRGTSIRWANENAARHGGGTTTRDTARHGDGRASTTSAQSPEATRERGYVLAAGRDAARDYRTLAEALAGTGHRAVVVCSRANLDGVTLPAGVDVRFDVPPATLRELYGRATVVVVPTRGDGDPVGSDCSGTLVTLDALAMGRPVVVTARASVPEYVTPGVHVTTVPAGDVAALRLAINEAMAPDRATATSAADQARAGQAHVRSGRTTDHFAAGIAQVFREVA